MLEQIVTSDIVKLHLEAEDWKDAVRKAAQPLVEEKDISPNYIDGIIRSAEEYGPYFVLAPHVALAHAPIEEGALRLALGVAVLEKPVKFNNKANDPVKYIFTLSSPDSNSHLQAMQELVGLLSTPSFYEQLDQAKDANEVVKIMSA